MRAASRPARSRATSSTWPAGPRTGGPRDLRGRRAARRRARPPDPAGLRRRPSASQGARGRSRGSRRRPRARPRGRRVCGTNRSAPGCLLRISWRPWPCRPCARRPSSAPSCRPGCESPPEPDFLPPCFEAFGELAIFAARSFDMPLSLRASYCFSFFTLARFAGMALPASSLGSRGTFHVSPQGRFQHAPAGRKQGMSYPEDTDPADIDAIETQPDEDDAANTGLVDPGIDRHDFATEWASLWEDAHDEPLEALPGLEDLVRRLLSGTATCSTPTTRSPRATSGRSSPRTGPRARSPTRSDRPRSTPRSRSGDLDLREIYESVIERVEGRAR